MEATEQPDEPAFQVYASFPRVVAFGVDLDLSPSNWDWVHCLEIPIDTLSKLNFSPRPYKWIRYAIGVVVGAEGDLSSCAHELNVVDYDAVLPIESATLYYHTSDDERRRMFPLDPHMAPTNITSSASSPRKDDFRSAMADRDGRCVLAEVTLMGCDAVHLLAHSKGDEYISLYTERRSRDPAGDDIVREIDSIRNGILLNAITHRVLGKNVAFLPMPNFAMNTTDVDPSLPPGENRFTAHLFEPCELSLLVGRRPGSPIRVSDHKNWPPAILFDAVYATTILYHFGTTRVRVMIDKTWKNIFYEDGIMNRSQVEHKELIDAQVQDKQKTERQAQERNARLEHHERSNTSPFDLLMALPYILVPQDELRATFREAREKAEKEKQERLKEKVEAWNWQVISSGL
ncbi:hypothetical protein CPB84DRAFT_1687646 [Gymnopilus junonius]|uniref:HNH nuclease domain-containing protein n=1 Tax=Gymnopilus junonius TaxID=109634 RepID=A0A9P5TH57_GYMJU|nr:hypothetical protein CPB84DRAFT_1687646 [Gymnopilus junonius]